MQALTDIWMVVATALVLSMQAGFLCLEAGMSRSKNALNVAMKNVSDAMVTIFFHLLFGFALMFGTHEAFQHFDPTAPMNFAVEHAIFFIFNASFAAAAATIASGVVAERMAFHPYIALSAVIGAFVYPIVGLLAWGDVLGETSFDFLNQLGYVDYAGAGVVHLLGAAVGLTAALMVGPRLGRFDEAGRPQPMMRSSGVMSALGMLLLVIGWIGFNAGAATPGSAEMGHILLVTIIGASTGGTATLALQALRGGTLDPGIMINGVLAGLVGITGGCAYLSIEGAVIASAAAAAAAFFGKAWVERRGIDDVVDAIAVHGIAAIVGLLLIPLFPLAGGVGIAAMGLGVLVQAVGILTILAIGIGSTWATLSLVGRSMPIRVSRENEEAGLNLTEHGVTLESELALAATREAITLQEEMSRRNTEASERDRVEAMRALGLQSEVQMALELAANGDLSGRVEIDPDYEPSVEIGGAVNQMLSRVGASLADLHTVFDAIARGDLSVRADTSAAGEFGEMALGANTSAERLQDLIGRITSTATRVTEASDRMQDQATAVAAAAEKSAEQIEEMAAATEEMTASVASTSASMVDAASNADGVNQTAHAGAAQVSKASEAVREIADKTAAIQEIVSEIEGIAFQTNLLALNAQVEAARAGDAGRSFAVVAEEVRKLARRVSDAVSMIAERVAEAETSVHRGGQLADAAAEALQAIRTQVAALVENVQSTAEASREQSLGLTEFTSAVQAIDATSQSNVSVSADTRRTAETLRTAAEGLTRQLGAFSQDGAAQNAPNGDHAPHRAAG